jgi:ATP-binding cassette subfamily B protein
MVENIKFKPKTFLLVWFSSFTFFITPLLGALLVREIFNNLEGTAAIEVNIWLLVVILLVVNAAQIVFDVAWAILQNIFFMSLRLLFRRNMMNGLYSQYGANPPPYSPGEAISRFRQDAEEAAYFPIAMADLLNFFIFGVIALLIMLDINSQVTFFIFLPFAFVIVLVNAFRKRVAHYRSERRKATGEVTSAIREIYSSIQSVKVNTAERNMLEHFKRINDKRGQAALKDEFFGSLLRATRTFVVFLATGIMFLMISEPMLAKEFSIGDFALFQYLLNWVTGFISYMGESIARYHRTNVSYNRMTKLMKGKSESIPEKDIVKASPLYLTSSFPPRSLPEKHTGDQLDKISTKKLSYNYPNSEKGIKDISFELKRGTLTVITGRVGSGKSTLLKAFLGLLPSTGTILWNDKEITDIPACFRPPRAAYTPQVPNLFSDTIKKNLLLGLPENPENMQTAINLAVFKKDLEEVEHGLNTVVGPKGKKLSGGQQQRLAAARMLLQESELKVFDDLSSALDVETEKIFWERMFLDKKNSTFLVVSHKPIVLQEADNIIILKKGMIEASGLLETLLNSSNEMKRLWEFPPNNNNVIQETNSDCR